MIFMKKYCVTDIGKKRKENEDSILCEKLKDQGYLLAVADGMGGHQAGKKASKTAIKELKKYVKNQLEEGNEKFNEILRKGFKKADNKVTKLSEENPKHEGMGTTLVAAIINSEKAVIGNIGDSRAYEINGRVEQITKDHSLVQSLIDAGEITEEKARNHPQRNVVTQTIGTESDIDVDLYERELNEVLMLCSDGLHDQLRDEEIKEIFNKNSNLETIGNKLIDKANQKGGKDNTSVVLIKS